MTNQVSSSERGIVVISPRFSGKQMAQMLKRAKKAKRNYEQDNNLRLLSFPSRMSQLKAELM